MGPDVNRLGLAERSTAPAYPTEVSGLAGLGLRV